MPKYINADKVIDYANQEVTAAFYYPQDAQEQRKLDEQAYREKWAFVKQVMIGTPAADAVEVCRCEQCVKSDPHLNGRWCKVHQTMMRNMDYCSFGEIKDV